MKPGTLCECSGKRCGGITHPKGACTREAVKMVQIGLDKAADRLAKGGS